MPDEILVAVAGAMGRMGQEVVRAIHAAEGLQLVAAIDRTSVGEDVGILTGIGKLGIPVRDNLGDAIRDAGAQVVVDFTVPTSAVENIRAALAAGAALVVGTTGITSTDVEKIGAWATDAGHGVLIAPNFAIGAVLMMQFAEQAAKYLPDVEIIEFHHERKLDSPSGTALRTAEMISAARTGSAVETPAGLIEKILGGRGASFDGIHIHSVRLPGHVAHQTVLFGSPGESLTIRHDSMDRKCFMPGVVLACRKVLELQGVVVGLEKVF